MLISLLHQKPPLCSHKPQKGLLTNFVQKLCPGTDRHSDTHPSTNTARVPESSRKKNAHALNFSWKRCWKNWSYKNVYVGSQLWQTRTPHYNHRHNHPRIAGAMGGDIFLSLLLFLFLCSSLSNCPQGDHTLQNVYRPLFQSVIFFSVQLFQ